MRAAMRIDLGLNLGPARLVSGRPGGLGGSASLRGRAGPALAGGFERRWAGSTDIFKVLSNLNNRQPYGMSHGSLLNVLRKLAVVVHVGCGRRLDLT